MSTVISTFVEFLGPLCPSNVPDSHFKYPIVPFYILHIFTISVVLKFKFIVYIDEEDSHLNSTFLPIGNTHTQASPCGIFRPV